jgi:hypothetical protein
MDYFYAFLATPVTGVWDTIATAVIFIIMFQRVLVPLTVFIFLVLLYFVVKPVILFPGTARRFIRKRFGRFA